MAAGSAVVPNRRGARSREAVLDAAVRVMAEHGYEAATVARIVDEAGIPPSSIYHYFGSKEGVLLAVLERGAGRFMADLPGATRRVGTQEQHLQALVSVTASTLERHPDFLRLLIVLATQPRKDGHVQAVVERVRALALDSLRGQFALVFGIEADGALAHDLARFTLAAFDGAFVAAQVSPDVRLASLLDDLPVALLAIRRRKRAPAR
jgi:AcrR family transcriptional regulator